MIINIDGPEGNSFTLISFARSLCKVKNMNSKPITDKMMSGDYKNLLTVFQESFDNVTLISDDPELQDVLK
jgi:hypothetical protein